MSRLTGASLGRTIIYLLLVGLVVGYLAIRCEDHNPLGTRITEELIKLKGR